MCLAIPGQIVTIAEDEPGAAVAEVGGVRRRINIDLVADDGVAPGDWVLIHVGFAMSKLEEPEARDQLRLISMLGDLGIDDEGR